VAIGSSGAIRLAADIGVELGQSSTQTVELADAATGGISTINTASASYPNSSAPHLMSEWYSYDHSASSWDNDTDWYDNAINSWWDSYVKVRIDFGYNSSYNGSGTTVTDVVESWHADASIISSASFTASTSTTTPGYITCGSGDCVHSWDEGALSQLNGLEDSNGTVIIIWFRRHTDHDGVLFSIGDNSTNYLIIESLNSGAMRTKVAKSSGFHSRTSNTSIITNNTWTCGVFSFDKFTSGKGQTYRINQMFSAYDSLNDKWYATADGYGTDCLDSTAWTGSNEPYGIGCIPSSSSAGASVFDGDVSLVVVAKGLAGTYGPDGQTDAKLNGFINDSHEKMGL